MKKIVCIIAGLLLLLAGCDVSDVTANNNNPGESTLCLSFTTGEAVVRTLQPEVDKEIELYRILGQGPDGNQFTGDVIVPDNTLLKESLPPGTWQVTVHAINKDDIEIGTGTQTVELVSGETKAVTITILPLAGVGTLDILLDWPQDSIAQPVIKAELIDEHSVSTLLSFTITAGSAVYTDNQLPAGYYALSIQLYDENVLTWGRMFGVRIMAGEITGTHITLTRATMNEASGLLVQVEEEMHHPVDIVFSGHETRLLPGNEFTITATPSEPVDSWQWYLNGQILPGETGNVITLGSTLPEGFYQLDVLVFTTHTISSGGIEFTVGYNTPAGPFTRITTNPVLTTGEPGAFDSAYITHPSIIFDEGIYRMYYLGNRGNYDSHIGMATSSDGIIWTKYSTDPIYGGNGEYAAVRELGSVIKDGPGDYKMYYSRYPAYMEGFKIYLATSSDGITWSEYGVVLTGFGSSGYTREVRKPVVIYDPDEQIYKMWYYQLLSHTESRVDCATSPDGITWTRSPNNPALNANELAWEGVTILTSCVIKESTGSYYMYYTSGGLIGLALSSNGIDWTKQEQPLFEPAAPGAWDDTSVGNGYVIKINNMYKLYYFGGNGSTASIGIAE